MPSCRPLEYSRFRSFYGVKYLLAHRVVVILCGSRRGGGREEGGGMRASWSCTCLSLSYICMCTYVLEEPHQASRKTIYIYMDIKESVASNRQTLRTYITSASACIATCVSASQTREKKETRKNEASKTVTEADGTGEQRDGRADVRTCMYVPDCLCVCICMALLAPFLIFLSHSCLSVHLLSLPPLFPSSKSLLVG